MISPYLWAIITEGGSKSFEQEPTFLAGNGIEAAPQNFHWGIKDKKKSFTIKLIHHYIKGPGRLGYLSSWEEFRTLLDKALSSFI